MLRKLLLVFCLSLLLIACKTELQPPDSPPGNFRVTAGDSSAVLTWDMQPGLIYSVYYQVGQDVSPGNYVDFATNIRSPFTITGLVNQTQYAFIINASSHGSLAGPSTPIVTVTPGGTGEGQAWTVGGGLTGQSLRSVAFGNQTYVAVGDAGAVYDANVSTNSSSGIGNWNPLPTVLPTGGANLAGVAFTGNGFVAVAANGDVITSLDGVNWNLATALPDASSATPPQMTGLAYGNGTLVAVGVKGDVRTNSSATANTAWVKRTVPDNDSDPATPLPDFFGVSYVNGVFIAMGQKGLLATSTDNGATWTIQNSGVPTSALYKAAFAGGVYVVVGDGGTILSSPDFVNWAKESAPTSNNLYGIAYGVSAEFVIVGANGTVLYSTSGTGGTWTSIQVGGTTLNDVVAGRSVFAAVGDFGANVSGK